MAPWLLVLLAVLATARLTRLITTDVILDGPRGWITRRLGDDSKVVYLIHCPWCSGLWISAAVAAAVYWRPCAWWVDWPLIALTASYVTGLLATRVEP